MVRRGKLVARRVLLDTSNAHFYAQTEFIFFAIHGLRICERRAEEGEVRTKELVGYWRVGSKGSEGNYGGEVVRKWQPWWKVVKEVAAVVGKWWKSGGRGGKW